MKRIIVFSLIAMLILGTFGCASMSRQQKGAAIGSGAGAAVGAVIGNEAGNTLLGAIIGAAVGGVAGAYIGNYMDNQAEEIERDLDGATVERVGEGIKITFDSGILFDINKADLQSDAKGNLTQLATILQKYPDTDILIEGHTDSDGSDELNMALSKRRAESVAAYLGGLQVDPTRFTIMGYGESQPVAENDSVSGKRANRRVDLAIMANDKLKKHAESEAG
ncbi:MAG: OmpA family protein [bacterium]